MMFITLNKANVFITNCNLRVEMIKSCFVIVESC